MKTLLEPNLKESNLKMSSRHDALICSIEEQTEGMVVEETPELLAAIDEGLRSAETEECIPIESVRAALKKKWATL